MREKMPELTGRRSLHDTFKIHAYTQYIGESLYRGKRGPLVRLCPFGRKQSLRRNTVITIDVWY
jgi:hypothetical protein